MSERTPYQPYGTAIYRREMNVHATDDGALGELVDDFHHFRARVKCDGDRVLEVVAESLRPPWSTCVEAERLLEHLEGMPLAPSLRAAGQYTPSRMQCTHMFDAAALAIARLGSGTGGVTYSIAIPDRVDGRTHATIERDGELLLEWDLVKNEIVGSEPFSGQQIVGHQFAAWAEASLDRDRLEATLLLQRACLISYGRDIDLESYARAIDVPGGPMGACHTYQEGNLERARRKVGSVRNLSTVRGRLADQS